MGMVLRQSASRRPMGRTAAAAGFSLIEVLIAMALLALILIGILPLFIKSMTNNQEGGQLSEVTNRARQHLEELMGRPFNNPELTIPAGQTTLLTRDLWSLTQERWIAEGDFPNNEEPGFSRTTRVRQFNVSAINDADLEFDDAEALVGGTPNSSVNLKEIEVRVNSGRPSTSNVLGRSKAVTLRALTSI